MFHPGQDGQALRTDMRSGFTFAGITFEEHRGRAVAPGSAVRRFVEADEGTGIVHIAPAYGEDDLKLGQKHGLPVLHGVGDDGYFLAAVRPVAGKFFKEVEIHFCTKVKDAEEPYLKYKLYDVIIGGTAGDTINAGGGANLVAIDDCRAFGDLEVLVRFDVRRDVAAGPRRRHQRDVASSASLLNVMGSRRRGPGS